MSWEATVSADVRSSRLSGGVEMLTAMMTSAHSWRAWSIGRLLAMPPSTSRRPSISTGAIAPGTDMLARMACARLPRFSTIESPVSMSVAIASNGIGRSSKLDTPIAGCARMRKYASIDTPAITPLGSARPPFLRPNSGAISVL